MFYIGILDNMFHSFTTESEEEAKNLAFDLHYSKNEDSGPKIVYIGCGENKSYFEYLAFVYETNGTCPSLFASDFGDKYLKI